MVQKTVIHYKKEVQINIIIDHEFKQSVFKQDASLRCKYLHYPYAIILLLCNLVPNCSSIQCDYLYNTAYILFLVMLYDFVLNFILFCEVHSCWNLTLILLLVKNLTSILKLHFLLKQQQLPKGISYIQISYIPQKKKKKQLV